VYLIESDSGNARQDRRSGWARGASVSAIAVHIADGHVDTAEDERPVRKPRRHEGGAGAIEDFNQAANRRRHNQVGAPIAVQVAAATVTPPE
jgi:hypothetical protein